MSQPLPPAATARLLLGQRVLVTGAARRIGRALALSLAAAGADVVITYRDSQADADSLVAELRVLGSNALALPCDVREEASVNQAVQAAIAHLGGLDILVNNAGAFETLVLEEISAAQWDAMFETNTRGPFLVARAAHAALKSAHGRIINIGSLGGIRAWATHGHYCTSKAALHMLSQTMAKAWAPEIAVNCVAPGMIVFGSADAPANQPYAHFVEKTPMRRNGTADDVAAAVLFFATAPTFITGQQIAVDGGLGL